MTEVRSKEQSAAGMGCKKKVGFWIATLKSSKAIFYEIKKPRQRFWWG